MIQTIESWQLDSTDIALIERALAEDLGQTQQDATTNLLFSTETIPCTAAIVSKHHTDSIVCGTAVIKHIMHKLDPNAHIDFIYQDGDSLAPGASLAKIHSHAQALLMAERTLLNFTRHLSGIATLTAQFVAAIHSQTTKILDTRKTTPGFRHLEKYAVHCGGGVNHRQGLYDAVMVKDNHIDLSGGMLQALAKLPDAQQKVLPTIIEVRNQAELKVVIDNAADKVDRVLLDNMPIAELKACVQLCQGIFPTEASGNLNLNTIADVASTGVDYASVGALTYAAGHIDLSLTAIMQTR